MGHSSFFTAIPVIFKFEVACVEPSKMGKGFFYGYSKTEKGNKIANVYEI